MADHRKTTAERAPVSEGRKQAPAGAARLDAFLAALQSQPGKGGRGRKGRLLFALDATMSRQPTWDRAQHLQSEMFEAAASLGGLEIKLVYFRGHKECKASRWTASGADLARIMSGIDCRGGHTQIGRVLAFALKETRSGPLDAVVYIGDSCEEAADHLCHLAGELGLLGAPMFLFQEGDDPVARLAFSEMARLTRGAHLTFDAASAEELRALLRAVAAYAAGGVAALAGRKRDRAALRLIEAMEQRG